MSIPAIPKDYYGHKTELFLDNLCNQESDNLRDHKHAIIYSIVETAKANNLKPFDYVQHLLEEIPKHMNDKDCSFLEDLLPWSEKLPAGIRKA